MKAIIIIASATIAIHIQKGNIILSPIPTPKASKKSPNVFLNAPINKVYSPFDILVKILYNI